GHDRAPLLFGESRPTAVGGACHDFMAGVAARRAARILTVYHFSAADVAASYRGVAERLRQVWNGIASGFRPVRERGALERVGSAYGLPESFVLYLGSCKPHKNLPRLLE